MAQPYDRISPGAVLSIHEDAGRAALIRTGHYVESDFALWGDESLLPRILHLHTYGGMAGDLRGIPLDEIYFNECDRSRPDPLQGLLGRRRLGDLGFLGGLIVPSPHHHLVFALLYAEDGAPRAYVPIQGNAVDSLGRALDDHSDGADLFDYDRLAIEADIRAHFAIP